MYVLDGTFRTVTSFAVINFALHQNNQFKNAHTNELEAKFDAIQIVDCNSSSFYLQQQVWLSAFVHNYDIFL